MPIIPEVIIPQEGFYLYIQKYTHENLIGTYIWTHVDTQREKENNEWVIKDDP